MNKNKIIFVFIISVIVIGSIIGTVFFLQRDTAPAETTPLVQRDTNEDFFPTGGSSGIPSGRQTGDQRQPETTGVFPETPDTTVSGTGNIKKMTQTSVASVYFINKNGGNPSLRYIEKGTGHINEISFDERIPTKVTNTTITAIQDAKWGENGEVVILRRTDGNSNNIQTIYGTIEESSDLADVEAGVKKINGHILPPNTIDFDISPDQKKIFYLIRNGDSVVGSISDMTKSKPSEKMTQVWASPMREWQIAWSSNNQISLTNKPSYNSKGNLFSISLNKANSFDKEIGNITGLTALMNNKGNVIVYTETTGTGFMTFNHNKNGGEVKVFPVRTLAEKCVFSKINENIIYCGVPSVIIGANYPDAWYQGVRSFSDSIWEIDLELNTGRVIIDNNAFPEEADIINPVVSEDENYFGFINKKDNTLWIAKIK